MPLLLAKPPSKELKKQIAAPQTLLEEEPKLGGEGSGSPPLWLVTTGQAGHAIVGIDIGNDFSRSAVLEQGKLYFIEAALTPSRLLFRQDGSLTVGVNECADAEWERLLHSLRPLLGSDWCLELENGSYTAEDCFAQLLRRVKERSESVLNRPVSKAVLTVPALFNSSQRSLLKAAAERENIEVIQLINEPTAAALAHCYKNPEEEGNYLIYALGGGSFACTVFTFRNGILEVKSTRGNARLGGFDFSCRIMEHFISRYEEKQKIPFQRDKLNVERLFAVSEQVKRDLTMSNLAHARLIGLSARPGLDFTNEAESRNIIDSINRDQFVDISASLIDETMSCVDGALEDSLLQPAQIDHVLLLGYPALMPTVTDRLRVRFPTRRLRSLKANESPACGAAIQASLLTQHLRDFVVWDVLTQAIGAESYAGIAKTVLARGTPLPVTGYYKCASPDGTINLTVRQGDDPAFANAVPLVELTINNCPPTQASESKVEVAFSVRADGVVEYSAHHVGLGTNLTVNLSELRRAELPVAPQHKSRRTIDEARLLRLARKLGVSAQELRIILRQQGYEQRSINDGSAIEQMLRRLRRRK